MTEALALDTDSGRASVANLREELAAAKAR